MAAWLIVLAIIAVCFTVLIYLRSTKEGFVTLQDLVNQGNPFADQMRFANTMGSYASDTSEKGIWTNPGVAVSGVNDAFKQNDPYLAFNRDRDYTTFFTPDPENAYSEQDKKFCKGALYPLDLPARAKMSKVACGWWFHPTERSVGVLGTVDGPLFRDDLAAGGTFYWNLEQAALKEDFKKCKRITSCDNLDLPGIKGVCGWCDRLGRAVPITANGTEKYPEAVDEETCGETVIASRRECPLPPSAEVATSGGKPCGTFGRPSADNEIRLYNRNECEGHFNGTFHGNGECTNPQGGSYSWECRSLNAPRTIEQTQTTTCTPDARGRLSRACLIETALSVGLSRQGSIYKLLYTSNSPTENDKLAIKYLQSGGLTVPEAVLGEGNIDRDSAANIYMQIFNTISTGRSEILRQSAKLLAVGTTEFDPCSIEGSSKGPFDVVCTQRAFRTAGCQPAGSDYPTNTTVADYATMSWDQVNKKFADLRSAVENPNADTQDDAMKRCLGFAYTRPPPVSCNDPGMEHLMYSWNWNDMTTIAGNHYAALIGVNRWDAGLKNVNAWGGVISDTANRWDQVVLKARGVVESPTTISGQIDMWTDDGLRVWKDGGVILNAWWDQGPTYYGVSVNFPAKKPSMFEVHWYENGGWAVLIARNAITAINQNVRLPFPKSSPIIAFDFFRGMMSDIHAAVRSEVRGTSQMDRGGRMCAFFGPNQNITVLNPIRLRLVKTYTMMVWFDSMPTNYISLALGSPNFGIVFSHNQNQIHANIFSTRGPSVITTANSSNLTGRWVHLAFVVAPSSTGFTIFIDGNVAASNENVGTFGGNAPEDIMKSTFIGGGGGMWRDIAREGGGASVPPMSQVRYGADTRWVQRTASGYVAASNGVFGDPTPGIVKSLQVQDSVSSSLSSMFCAWVHMYDYAMSPTQVKEDQDYWNKPEYSRTPIPSFSDSNWNRVGHGLF